MADQQNVNVVDSSGNSVPVEPRNPAIANPSSYSAYLAWAQYWQYYYTYSFYYYNAFYYNLLSRQAHLVGPAQQANNNTANSFVQNNVGAAPWTPQAQQGMVNGLIGRINVQRTGVGSLTEIRYKFVTASLRKRAIAEFIDFVFLYFLKYSFYSLYFKSADQLSHVQYSSIIYIIDEATSLKEIEEVLIQALIYRLMVVVYEAFFLAVPLLCSFGGATPGKYMMGITVISYQGLAPIPGQNVLSFAGTATRRLHPGNACIRAVLKNFMITFFFPIMLSVMFVRDLRTPYDFIASSMVIDADPKRLRQA